MAFPSQSGTSKLATNNLFINDTKISKPHTTRPRKKQRQRAKESKSEKANRNLQRPRQLLCAVRVKQVVRLVVHEACLEDISVQARLVLHHLAPPAAAAKAIGTETAARIALHWMKQSGPQTFTGSLPTLSESGQERRKRGCVTRSVI